MKSLMITLLSLLCGFSLAFGQMQLANNEFYENIQANYEYKFIKKIEKKKRSFDEYYFKMQIQVENPEPLYSTSKLLVNVQVLNTEKTVYTCAYAADYEGRATDFTTKNGSALYQVPNGTFNTTCSFRVPAGIEPILEVNTVRGYLPLSSYDVVVTNKGLAGIWVQSGSEQKITLKAVEEDLTITTKDKKTLTWKKLDPKKYQRIIKNDSEELYTSTLKITDPNTISYTNSEGIVTIWKRQ